MILGQNVPNLSHLPENIHKRFCARPAEKQDALFCCSVNFPRWRYVFERLPPAVTDKIATISEENSGEGDTFSSAVYYRFPKDFEKKEGISHEHNYRHRPRLLRYQDSAYRKFLIGRYVALFKIDEPENAVEIYRIFHGTQNYTKYL